jgi:hypothetical protein
MFARWDRTFRGTPVISSQSPSRIGADLPLIPGQGAFKKKATVTSGPESEEETFNSAAMLRPLHPIAGQDLSGTPMRQQSHQSIDALIREAECCRTLVDPGWVLAQTVCFRVFAIVIEIPTAEDVVFKGRRLDCSAILLCVR